MKKILNRKEKLVPILINLLNSDEIWDAPYKKYSEWTPISIIHILSVMGGKEAFDAVKNAILIYYDETGDWITEDMPSVMATFGPQMFVGLTEMIKDTTVDNFIRAGIARSLLQISAKFPETREKSVEVIKEVISKEKEGKQVISLLTDELVEFKDKGSLSFIEHLFKEKLVDESIITLDDVYEIYETEDDYFLNKEITNPLHIFKENSFYRESNTGDYLNQQIDDDGSNIPNSKIGRNDLCPCESGKKYKKVLYYITRLINKYQQPKPDKKL